MYCSSILVSAQTDTRITTPTPISSFNEGKRLFTQKDYTAAQPFLQSFLKDCPSSLLKQETEYMLACTAYELKDKNRIQLLRNYIKKYPDTPYKNRIHSLLASCYFYNEKYKEALTLFDTCNLSLLSDEERDDCTYQLAICQLNAGDVSKAVIWFETLKNSTKKYKEDCIYYLSYIRYTQKKYNESLNGFLSIENNKKYEELIPYYISDIYSINGNYKKAQETALKYLSEFPNNAHSAEIYRILGDGNYHLSDFTQAIKDFETYISLNDSTPRRDALYMLGISYFRTNVYTKATTTLGQITAQNDVVSQNAYLYMGLSYLQLAERNKARMAFEQAAASDANRQLKEQAAYNYALCVHETAYSAFGESVIAFEKFLNEFPNSIYTEKISNYLVDVYMNTRSYQAALKSINRVSKPNSHILEAKQRILFQLGTEALANASFEKAVEYLNSSISLGQYNQQTKADALYWRGESYYDQNRMQEAANDFKGYCSLTRQPEKEMYALAHYNLGYTAFHQKDYAQALQWFQQYISLEKKNNQKILADTYNRIGDCYLHSRFFDNAINNYSQAQKINTETGDYSFYQLALVSGLQKNYAEKITLLNRLRGMYPSSPYAANALYETGESYVQMNNNSQAISSFKKLLNKYPKNPITRKAAAEIGLLYFQDNNYDQAIKAYKQVIENYPGSDEAQLSLQDLKSIYVDMNRIEDFTTLVQTLPGNAHIDISEQDSLTYTAAEKIYMRRQTIEARKSLESYLQKFPQGAFTQNAHYFLCLIGQKLKNNDMILLHSEKLLEYPDNPYSEEVLIMRSEVLFNQQQWASALTSYKLLKEKATTAEHRILAETGILRCSYLMKDYQSTIKAATDLLAETKITPNLKNEALYYRSKSYLSNKNDKDAMIDLQVLSEDIRNAYGAEAGYLIAQKMYDKKEYKAAEQKLLDYIKSSTPQTYWLARCFILLSDVYSSTGKELDARQYLLSLQQNYQGDSQIQNMIENRLKKLSPKTK